MKAGAVFLVLLFVGMMMFIPGRAGATSGSIWSEGAPTVMRDIPLSSDGDSTCSTYRQDVLVSEYAALKSVCIYGDAHLKIGNFFENGRNRGAVGFAFSSKMSVLEGVCVAVCRYSSATDTLVTQQQIAGDDLGLVVYRHASQRIQQVIVPPLVSKFVFDTTRPDYEMKNDVGHYVSTPTFNISRNGEWAVAELYGSGTVVLDLNTFVARQITANGPGYGYGMDPSEQLAIANDGKSVAVTGGNSGFYIFDIVDGCGQALVGNLTLLPGVQSCPSSDIGIYTTFPNFYRGSRPRFFGNGRELEVTVASWGDGVHRVMFGVHGTTASHRLRLLSLGDSFSSGEGETDDNYYVPGTNQSFDTCHVSSRAYSGLLASALAIHDGEAQNLSCSGATTADVMETDTEYWGQGSRLGLAGLKLSTPERDATNEAALDSFQPGRALQADFIARYNPEILTIGIGGNDAGLMGKLRTCAMPGTCEWAGEGFRSATAGEITRLYGTLNSLFSRILEPGAQTEVFIAGYPSIIDPDGQCDLVTGYLFDHSERVYIQNSIHYLNQVIHLAARTAGFHYVDIEHSLDGQQLCGGASTLAMNGLRFGDDVAVVPVWPMLKIVGRETFHPTPIGHTLISAAILAQYPGLTVTPVVDNGFAANPSPYWGDGASNVPALYYTDFAETMSGEPSSLIIQLPNGSLQPGSTATVEIHSEPVQLASLVAHEDGSAYGKVSLPESLVEGFHTLHLLGDNRAGESIDMYEFLTIGNESELLGLGSEGNVVGGSVVSHSGNDGDDRSDGGRNDRSSVVDHIVDAFGSDLGSVLGAEVVREEVSVGQEIVTSIISRVQQAIASISLLFMSVLAGVLIAVLIVVIILLRRRWSKPSS